MSAAAGAVTEALHELHTRFTGLRDGRPADYIPQLTRIDPDAFGPVSRCVGVRRSAPCRSGSACI
ncbi:hypothetical protein GCM10015535_61540 [Streptomyces gelaticus]|uniref:Glutaminase n=1 Tax=Streptomyces gelaticus TaxID=285446 RepID=A0ABQ2WAW6_9ACTN|nr:hypothetical protein GCM10015535_61540 [Streptomyces gelaticus]